MRLVIECLRCERACRDLAAGLENPNDKRALELMATGWARRAAERLRKIEGEAVGSLAPLVPLGLPPTAPCDRAVRTGEDIGCA
jgi:hypothetical protein